MHVLTVGGSGQTGSLVIKELLSNDQTVTALVRDPSSLEARHGLTVIQGTPANIEDITRAFNYKRPDAIIITLAHVKGVAFGEKGTTPFLTHVTNNIIRIIRNANVSGHASSQPIKIAYMSAFGVGASFPNLNFVMRGLVGVTPLRQQFADHEGAENALQRAVSSAEIAEARFSFVVARPVMLKNGKREGDTVTPLGENGEMSVSFMPVITRASVARFLVDVALDKNVEWDGKTVVIANAP